jgi:hypothetical protein
MSARPSFLSRLLGKLKPAKAAPRPLAPPPSAEIQARREAPVSGRRSRRSSIESLEGRIAPAAIISGGQGISYTDGDGDHVTITFSKTLFTGGTASTNLANVFTFDTGGAAAASTVKQSLQLMDLTRLLSVNGQNPASGISLFVAVTKADGGDGLADLGAIKATGLALGNVTIQGDLGQIDVGRNDAPVALNSLTVDSLGKLTTTQFGSPTYESTITGKLGTFTAREVAGGFLHAVDGFGTLTTPSVAKGTIGKVVVTESIHSRDAAVSADNDGLILTTGNIDSILIGTNRAHTADTPADGLVGGKGDNSGSNLVGGTVGTALIQGDITGGEGVASGVLSAGKNIGRVEVRGFLLGGDGDSSGEIGAAGNLGVVKIARTVNGQVQSGITAGAGTDSGLVFAFGSINDATVVGDITGAAAISDEATGISAHAGGVSAVVALKKLTVTGSLVGGVGDHLSGFIEGTGSLGTIAISGNVLGGDGDNSGVIITDGAASSITVSGYVLGGDGVSSGGVLTGFAGAGKLGSLVIGDGLSGGAGDGSGFIDAFSIGSARILVKDSSIGRAAVQGLGGDASGAIHVASGAGTIFLGGAVAGGEGANSGVVDVHGATKSLIAGDVMGAKGKSSGAILASDLVTDTKITAGSFGTITVGDIVGGDGALSGRVVADGGIGSLTAGNLLQGVGELSGLVRAGMGVTGHGNVGTLKLGHVGDTGNPVVFGGTVQVNGTVSSFSATDIFQANIAAERFGTFAAGNVQQSVIAAEGGATAAAKTDLAFKSITVTHNVTTGYFLAGYDLNFQPVNGHAQIGAVTVGGNWTSSSLVAGVRDLEHDGFGDSDDLRIQTNDGSALVSKIASITIKGTVSGTAGSGDHYGFIAQQIGALTIGGQRFAVTATGTELTANSTMDVTARAIG